MDNNTASQTPEAGPPKKGFFGFIAKLFSKQPTPPSHVDQSAAPVEPVAPAPVDQNPPVTSDGSQPPAPQPVTLVEPSVSTPVTPVDPLAQPVPTIEPDHDPQPLAVPESLEGQTIQADGTKVSPTLPTQPPAPANAPVAPAEPSSTEPPVSTPQQQ